MQAQEIDFKALRAAGPGHWFFLSYMTISVFFLKIWQFTKIVIFKYDNFNMTIILKIFKIWQSAIWQCFFNFQKYDNSHFFAFLRCLDLYYIFHSPKFQPLEIVIFEIWQSEYDNIFEKFSNMTISNMIIILKLTKYDNLQYDN